jgi:putative tricarboxylic transport membrane protein
MLANMFSVLTPEFVFCVALGSILGLLVGTLPGLSAITGVALVVSISTTWSPNNALAMIMGVYVVACFAGAITAILMNIPGAPSSVATTLDGYPLAKKGRAKTAILTAVIYSAAGSVISFIALLVIAKPMSWIALRFSPMDYVLLSVFGLATVGAVASRDFIKGLISAVIGVILSCVGVDPIMGIPRFTFGLPQFLIGIPAIPAIIGLFCLSEIVEQSITPDAKGEIVKIEKETVKLADIMRHWRLGIRSSIIGILVGILPGTGAPVAALLAYGDAKKSVKKPTAPFGEGAIEGIVASESANNAVVGGALIPMLALGIPGDSVTMIILSVFYIHGLIPGPQMFSLTPHLFSAIIMGCFLGCVFLLLLGYSSAPLLAKVIRIPKPILFPVVLVLCVVGSYANANNLFEVFLMTVFGFIGYYMKRNNYSPAALVLGMVLGPLMDNNFRRAVSLALGSENLAANMFLHPITVVLLILIAGSLLSNNKSLKMKVRATIIKLPLRKH